ncbi:hypothetical protein EYF80_051951 [Liparis tanakae]|uniref:Uncharacterized protein n=1 Tax=Liparis tanakae TaxID=230148 RepID=A0A4Z2F9K9_9TELE|nr:hypothetical protein EYF80_051951 [Liparis tanakae]
MRPRCLTPTGLDRLTAGEEHTGREGGREGGKKEREKRGYLPTRDRSAGRHAEHFTALSAERTPELRLAEEREQRPERGEL